LEAFLSSLDVRAGQCGDAVSVPAQAGVWGGYPFDTPPQRRAAAGALAAYDEGGVWPAEAPKVLPKLRTPKPIPDEKMCPRCEVTLPLEAFGVSMSRWDGVQAYCRTCKNAAARGRRTAL
jgi:hypothetical protein